MKKMIVFLITLFWVACSSNPTEPEAVILEARSLAISSSNQLFVTTQEGLCQSLDDGETWKSINRDFTRLVAVSPSGTIYCLKTESIYSPGLFDHHNEWLYRSTDNGKTFHLTGWAKSDIFFGMSWLTFNKQEHLFAHQRFKGLFRSTSQGEHWEELSGGSVSWGSVSFSSNSLIAPDKIFRSAGDGVYRSDDDGDNWIKVLELQDISGDTSYSYGALTFNSQGRIFAGINAQHFLGDSVETGMIYQSDDNGNNWIKTAALNSDIAHLAVNSEDKIFALTDINEVYCSIDNGIQWNKVSVISIEGWGVLQFIISSNNKLFIRTSDPKLYRSQNEGVTWEQIQPHL